MQLELNDCTICLVYNFGLCDTTMGHSYPHNVTSSFALHSLATTATMNNVIPNRKHSLDTVATVNNVIPNREHSLDTAATMNNVIPNRKHINVHKCAVFYRSHGGRRGL